MGPDDKTKFTSEQNLFRKPEQHANDGISKKIILNNYHCAGGLIGFATSLAIYLYGNIDSTIENPRSLLQLTTHISGGFSVSFVRDDQLTQLDGDTRWDRWPSHNPSRLLTSPIDILSESVLYNFTISLYHYMTI